MNRYCFLLDLGCGNGRLFPKILKGNILGRATIIGGDINKKCLLHIQRVYKKFVRSGKIQVICLDLTNLPFRDETIDLIVCSSVFEHILELGEAMKKIKSILKRRGTLVAGYPVETKLLILLLKLFYSKYEWTVNPRILGIHEYLRNPDTHKQNYRSIRRILKRNFTIQKIKKVPFEKFPDFLSIYEVVSSQK